MASDERNTVINHVGEVTGAILAFNVETLLKSPNYGGLHFVDGQDDVERVREIATELRRGGGFPLLSVKQLRAVVELLVSVHQDLEAMSRYRREDRNEPQSPLREKLISNLRTGADNLAAAVLPFLGYVVARDRSIWEAAKAEVALELQSIRTNATDRLNGANDARRQIVDMGKEADAVLEKIRVTSAEVGVKAYAKTFGGEAESHRNTAWLWLLLSLVTAGLGIWIVLTVLTQHEIPADAGPGKIAQYVLLRLVLIVLVYFVPLWCSRNYRAERHLEVVNRHRVNALLTFETFVSATKHEATRNAVLLEATRCIFAQTQTGYLGGDESLPADRILEVVKTATGKSE